MNIKITPPRIAFLIIALLLTARVCGQASGLVDAPVIKPCLVIPAQPTYTVQHASPAVQAALVPGTSPQKQAADAIAPVETKNARPASAPRGKAGDFSDFGNLTIPASPGDKAPAKPAKPEKPTKAAKDEKYEQMILEMRTAVQAIAAQYGNPSFAQVFTNDTLRAQLLRKRVQFLHRIDDITAEIAALEEEKTVAKGEVDAARRELVVLQKQSVELGERLSKARLALNYVIPTQGK